MTEKVTDITDTDNSIGPYIINVTIFHIVPFLFYMGIFQI